MRSIAFLGLGLSLLLGLGASQPAAAGDDSHYRGADVYVHHHVYYPARRIRHVYHVHAPGPRHVHVVHYAGNPHVWAYARGSNRARPFTYYWRGGDRRW